MEDPITQANLDALASLRDDPMPELPTKVQRVLNYLANNVEYRPWQNVTAGPSEASPVVWVITAERPGNVFTAERLQLFVWVQPSREPYPGIKFRASQSFRGGTLYRFGDLVKIGGWKEMWKVR